MVGFLVSNNSANKTVHIVVWRDIDRIVTVSLDC